MEMVLLLSFAISAILAIVFGIVILIWPESLSYLIAIWLIVKGILQLISFSKVIDTGGYILDRIDIADRI